MSELTQWKSGAPRRHYKTLSRQPAANPYQPSADSLRQQTRPDWMTFVPPQHRLGTTGMAQLPMPMDRSCRRKTFHAVKQPDPTYRARSVQHHPRLGSHPPWWLRIGPSQPSTLKNQFVVICGCSWYKFGVIPVGSHCLQGHSIIQSSCNLPVGYSSPCLTGPETCPCTPAYNGYPAAAG